MGFIHSEVFYLSVYLPTYLSRPPSLSVGGLEGRSRGFGWGCGIVHLDWSLLLDIDRPGVIIKSCLIIEKFLTEFVCFVESNLTIQSLKQPVTKLCNHLKETKFPAQSIPVNNNEGLFPSSRLMELLESCTSRQPDQ